MIQLYQFPTFWDLPNLSVFCMKVETYLRMVKLPFEVIPTSNPQKGPKGKLPYIREGEKVLADSSFIIADLKQRYGDPLDGHLSPQQKALGFALQRLLEEHLYWVLLYSRWINPSSFAVLKQMLFGNMPFPIKTIFPLLVQKKMRSALYQQGIGRHSEADIYHMGLEDLSVISTLLKESSFLLGNEPATIDACGYAFIANILYVPLSSPLKEYAESQPHFATYCEKMKTLFYEEKESATPT